MRIAIYGAGGFGRHVAWIAEDCRAAGSPLEIVAFIDDHSPKLGTAIKGIPVHPLETVARDLPDALIVPAIGAPKDRELACNAVRHIGLRFTELLHPSVQMPKSTQRGVGTVVCAGTTISADVRFGDHVQVNMGCTIGHDVCLGDFATLGPGAHVSGWVSIGERAYVGSGAVFVHGTEDDPLIIGDDAVIGAGACVTGPVARGTTVVGNPARRLRQP